MISIPITVEQIVVAVKQLQPNERAEVALALYQSGLHSDLSVLIQELYNLPPMDNITDQDILAEIQAVRGSRH